MPNLFDLPDAIGDTELREVVAAALRSSSGRATRAVDCWAAGVVAETVLDHLAAAGLVVVRPVRRLRGENE